MVLKKGGSLYGLGMVGEEVIFVVLDTEVAESVVDERVPVFAVVQSVLLGKVGIVLDDRGDEVRLDLFLAEVWDIRVTIPVVVTRAQEVGDGKINIIGDAW